MGYLPVGGCADLELFEGRPASWCPRFGGDSPTWRLKFREQAPSGVPNSRGESLTGCATERLPKGVLKGRGGASWRLLGTWIFSTILPARQLVANSRGSGP